ncbi:MAG: hypothetical protein ACRDMV_12785 [Streptosporangiales bacterium]
MSNQDPGYGAWGGQGPTPPWGRQPHPPQPPYGRPGGQYPGPPPGGPQGPGGPFGGPPPSGGGPNRSKAPLVVALVVVGVLVLAGGTVGGVALVHASGDESPSPEPSPTAATSSSASSSPTPTPTSPSPALTSTSPTPSSTVPISNRLDKRAWDKKPLTLKELFPKRYKASKKRHYKRYARRLNHSCAKVMRGRTLKRAMRRGHCTQVARATYVDKKKDIVATIGVANLATVGDTRQARAALSPGSGILPKPLNGHGPASFRGKRILVHNAADGHYLVFGLTTRVSRDVKGVHDHRANRAAQDMRDLIAVPLLKRKLASHPS